MRGLAGRRVIAAVARGLSCQLEGISSNASAQLVCSVAQGSPCVGGWKESQRECWRHNLPHVSPVTRQLHVAERTFCTSPAASEPADAATEDGSSTSAAADSGDTSLEEHSLALDSELTPKAVVEKLDKNIVGQEDAKKAVAIALRNRWRRHRVSKGMQEEIVPKNILMIGPTGCGKTEIARRLAKLADAPFVKVEATKFTEVGFHGRDVDQIVRDLVDNSMLMVKERLRSKHKKEVEQKVENIILQALFGPEPSAAQGEAGAETVNTHETFRRHLHSGLLEDREIKVEVNLSSGSGDPLELIGDMMARIQRPRGPRREQRTMTVREAREVLSDQEMEKYFSQESIQREAITAVEQDGIVFIDEIDKIVTNSSQRYSVDASSEGVQRDLLPIIEGSVVQTKAGNVKTDHVLFICSGSFHACKPSDMLAELQGRLPIRVELKGLTRDDFYRILTEPENNMIHQQQALLGTEGVELKFTEGAIREIARVAEEANRMLDNIGARRLHTILERIVEDVSFNAPELRAGVDGKYHYQVDRELVAEKVAALLRKKDMSKYVL